MGVILLYLSLLLNQDMLFIPAVLLVAFLIDKKAVYFVIAAIILIVLVKPIIAEQRPCFYYLSCESGYGFPSGHATLLAALAFSQIKKKSFIPLLLLAIFVGYTRVFLGVHTPEQVFAGFGLAALILEMSKIMKWSYEWEYELRHIKNIFDKYIKRKFFRGN